jgi:hypothetical protein
VTTLSLRLILVRHMISGYSCISVSLHTDLRRVPGPVFLQDVCDLNDPGYSAVCIAHLSIFQHDQSHADVGSQSTKLLDQLHQVLVLVT